MSHSVRKPPNAFNFIRQIQLLQRAGSTSSVDGMFEACMLWDCLKQIPFLIAQCTQEIST